MFVEKDKPYTITFCVEDVNGTKITNDHPYVLIKNRQTSQYYNGLFYTDDQTKLQLRYSSNGVYVYTFTPDCIADFDILCKSDQYNLSLADSIKVYDSESNPEYEWQLGKNFVICVPSSSAETKCVCCIMRESDGYYYNSNGWTNAETQLDMSQSNEVWTFDFTPNEVDKYVVTICAYQQDSEESIDYIYTLNVKETEVSTTPVVVSSSTIRSEDGSSTVVMNEKLIPIAGAEVSAYNVKTKELVSKTTTKKDGTWSFLIPKGSYIFMFSKKRFMSVSLERSVE